MIFEVNKVKKNAFTLIELLSVIVILTLMGALVIPIVENSINSGKDDLYIAQLDSIKASLKKYAIEKVNSQMKTSGDRIFLSLYQLKMTGFISIDIKDPRSETLIPDDMLLSIEKREKSYVYEVLSATGTKRNLTKFNEGTPIITVNPVVYYCPVTSEVSESFMRIVNDYTISSGSATIEYYDETFTSKKNLSSLLNEDKSFRIVYKKDNAYAIKNILRSGCD